MKMRTLHFKLLLALALTSCNTNDKNIERSEVKSLIPLFREAKEYQQYLRVGFFTISNVNRIQGRADNVIDGMHILRNKVTSMRLVSKNAKQLQDSLAFLCDLAGEAGIFLRKTTQAQNQFYDRWGTLWMYGEGGQRVQKEIKENSRKWITRNKQCDCLATRLDSTFTFFLPDSFHILINLNK